MKKSAQEALDEYQGQFSTPTEKDIAAQRLYSTLISGIGLGSSGAALGSIMGPGMGSSPRRGAAFGGSVGAGLGTLIAALGDAESQASRTLGYGPVGRHILDNPALYGTATGTGHALGALGALGALRSLAGHRPSRFVGPKLQAAMARNPSLATAGTVGALLTFPALGTLAGKNVADLIRTIKDRE